MIDFVKIKCLGIDSPLWLNHTDFDFKQTVSYKTGEIDLSPLRYEYKGLNFSLIPTQNDPNKHTNYIRGSLHKFKNDGLTNANDFTIADIIQVVNALKRYHVEPTNAILENIEFGVNIKLPFSCDTVLSRMVSGANRKFKEDEVFIKRIVFDRFEVKIYDKGRIETGKVSDLLRIEIRIKKMDCLKNVVATLADLTEPNKLYQLGEMLIERLESIVIHDENLDQITRYSIHEQIKVANWINPNFWANLTDMKRFNEKKAFAEFQKRTNTGTIKTYLINAVSDKWNELLNITTSVDLVIGNGLEVPKMETVSSSGNGFRKVCTNILSEKMETVSSSGNGFRKVCPIKINGTFIIEQQQKERGVQGGKPTITNSRTCYSCGIDISHKRPQTQFCSTKCKNNQHNPKRDRHKVKATPSVSEPNLSNIARFDIMAALVAMANSMKM